MGPTGLMLAAELALAGVDVAIVERRVSQDLAGLRAGGLHSRTIEVLDQRGIADRFLSQGQKHPVVSFHQIPLEISDFPARHNYLLALWQNHIERILAGWVGELAVPIYRGREVTGFAQDEGGVDVELSNGQRLKVGAASERVWSIICWCVRSRSRAVMRIAPNHLIIIYITNNNENQTQRGERRAMLVSPPSTLLLGSMPLLPRDTSHSEPDVRLSPHQAPS